MTTAPVATWLPVGDGTRAVDVFALLPAGTDELRVLYESLWEADVDRATLELCQERVTALVGLRPNGPTPTAASDSQRAALDFAEQFVLDPHGCTDEQMLGLQDHFTHPQLATLTVAVAVFDALARAREVLARPEEDQG